MVRQRLPKSTRPAAGADPFLTIKILQSQAFSENQVCRDRFYLDTKNRELRGKNEHNDQATCLQLKDTSSYTSPLIIITLKGRQVKTALILLQIKLLQKCHRQNSSNGTDCSK